MFTCIENIINYKIIYEKTESSYSYSSYRSLGLYESFNKSFMWLQVGTDGRIILLLLSLIFFFEQLKVSTFDNEVYRRSTDCSLCLSLLSTIYKVLAHLVSCFNRISTKSYLSFCVDYCWNHTEQIYESILWVKKKEEVEVWVSSGTFRKWLKWFFLTVFARHLVEKKFKNATKQKVSKIHLRIVLGFMGRTGSGEGGSRFVLIQFVSSKRLMYVCT